MFNYSIDSKKYDKWEQLKITYVNIHNCPQGPPESTQINIRCSSLIRKCASEEMHGCIFRGTTSFAASSSHEVWYNISSYLITNFS